MEGKQRDGVSEPADGDLAGHGDGGGVDQFFHTGADEGPHPGWPCSGFAGPGGAGVSHLGPVYNGTHE